MMTCGLCGTEGGAIMLTIIESGDVTIIGADCWPGFALGLIPTVLEGMTADSIKAGAEMLDAIYAADPRAPKPPAKPGGRKPRTTKATQAATGDAQSVPEAIEVPEAMRCGCGATTATGDADKLVCDGCGQVLATADALAG